MSDAELTDLLDLDIPERYEVSTELQQAIYKSIRDNDEYPEIVNDIIVATCYAIVRLEAGMILECRKAEVRPMDHVLELTEAVTELQRENLSMLKEIWKLNDAIETKT